jgi:hypothetical protein
MATRKIVPREDNEGGIGTALKRWASGFFATATIDSATIGTLSGIVKAATGVLSATALGAANLKFFINAAGAAPEWSKGIKLSVYTHDVSITGNQTLTGAGFLPTLARILFFIPDVLSGHGVGDGTINYCVHYDAVYPNDAMSSSTQIIVAYTAVSQQFSAVLTFNADGGVLTWSKINSPTGTCTILVEWLR